MAGNIPCGYKGCATVPEVTPGAYVPSTYAGYTWSKTFPTNSVNATITATEFNTVGNVTNIYTNPSVVPNLEECDCDYVPPYDPVYASIRMFVGAGVGYKRSKTVLCKASAENLGNVTPEGCPIREFEYLVHINRITENHVIDRSKNVKSKN